MKCIFSKFSSGLEGKDNAHEINQSSHNKILAFFVYFEENQLLDGDGCNWELPALLLIAELRFLEEKNK